MVEKDILYSKEKFRTLGLKAEEVGIWEDGLRTSGDRGTFEWWYIDGKFDDGTTVVVVFFTKDGFDIKGKAHPLVNIEITSSDGEKIESCVYGEKGKVIDASKEKCHVKIDKSYLRYVDGDFHLRYEGDGIVYDVILESTLPMWRPGTGHLYFEDEKYFAWLAAQPSAKITGSLSLDGEVRNLLGTGYHDHNWGNVPMNKVINHWYWGRARVGEYDIIACDIVSHKKYGYRRQPVFMLAKDGEIIEDDSRRTLLHRSDSLMHGITGKFIDNKLVYVQEGEDNIHYWVEFQRREDISVVRFLHDGSHIHKFIAKLTGLNPSYIRIGGEVTLKVRSPKGEEIIKGEGIWEQMFFSRDKHATIGH